MKPPSWHGGFSRYAKNVLTIIIKNDNNIINDNKRKDNAMRDLGKIIMNPIRQRIVQYLLIHGKASPKEIGKELNDIPTPTLYRHIKVLLEADAICVVEEEQVRGAIQKTYAMNPDMLGDADSEKLNALIQSSLNMLSVSFQTYFAKKNADIKKDMLSFTTSTLALSDEECAEFFQKLNDVVSGYLTNSLTEDRKLRRITLISSPCEEE